MSQNLDNLLQTPGDLAVPAIMAAILPDSGVTAADLNTSISIPGVVTIVPNQSAYGQPGWVYYGHALANYQQLNMADVFGTYEMRLMVDVPTMAHDIANLFSEIFEVAIGADDVIDEVIPTLTQNGMSYLLKANPNSIMWKGSRMVKLYQTSTQPDV